MAITNKSIVYTVEARGLISKDNVQIIGVYSTKNHAYIAMKDLSRRMQLEFRLIEWKCINYGMFPGRTFQDVSTVLKDWETPL